MNNQKVLQGQIIAESVTIGNPKWGGISGDISNQTDLIKLLQEKKDSDAKEIVVFFNTHPEYEYRFLLSMAGRLVEEVKDYFQLIIDGFVNQDELWIPYDVSKLCQILKVDTRDLANLIRFYVPYTGQIGVVDISDESGVVKYTYKLLGDDCLDVKAEWGNITGSLDNQIDLAEALDSKVSGNDFEVALEVKVDKTDHATSEDIEALFS